MMHFINICCALFWLKAAGADEIVEDVWHSYQEWKAARYAARQLRKLGAAK